VAKKKASEKTAVRALSGKRVMTKEFMDYKFEMDSPASLWTTEKHGYHNVTVTGQVRAIYSESYYDLSGFTRDYMTTFPQRIAIQEGGTFELKEDNASPKKGMVILELIVEENLSHTEITTMLRNIYDFGSPAGFSRGPLEFSQIIFGRYRLLGQNNTIWTATNGILTQLDVNQFGSGTPTTTDKLWCYRMIMPLGSLLIDTDDFILVPPARYVMSATFAQEEDKAYLMRQKNSYELATND
jgi:hypothetical protein